MRRIWHPFTAWEDWHAGQYALSGTTGHIGLAIRLLSAPLVLLPTMRTVVQVWPISAAVNMTNGSRNRQAWLGQASCCYLCGSPEVSTKTAWRRLTNPQRDEANGVADVVIAEWDRGNQLGLFA